MVFDGALDQLVLDIFLGVVLPFVTDLLVDDLIRLFEILPDVIIGLEL